MTVTMLIGSFIGGATSEGGGAVAFPVMTLILKLSPAVARDFSLMVQCCGRFNIKARPKEVIKWQTSKLGQIIQLKNYLKTSIFVFVIHYLHWIK